MANRWSRIQRAGWLATVVLVLAVPGEARQGNPFQLGEAPGGTVESSPGAESVSGRVDRMRLDVLDGRISMTADAVPLSDLLRMFDRATGTESTVADHLRSRNMSVSFEDLAFGDAVRKIFEGQSLDYVVVGRDRIMVTAESGVAPPQAGPMTRTAPGSSTATTQRPATTRQGVNQPPNPFQLQPNVPTNVQQPINTPFGQIFNQQGVQTRRTAPAVPGSSPAQPSSLFGNTSPTPFGNQTPPASPATPTPQSPFPTPVQPRP